MASSDDEEVRINPHLVSKYYFEDEDSNLVPFSVLPIWLVGKEKPNASENGVYLRGSGNAKEKIYKEVIAYRVGLEDASPEISALTKDRKRWIKLSRPRKVYEAAFRSIFITIHSLHYLRMNTDSSGKNLWAHLGKVFSSFVQFCSAEDLLNHRPLIKLLVESDNKLARCQFLLSLLEDKPRMKASLEDNKKDLEPNKSFVVTDDEEDDKGSDTGDESNDEIDLYDSVCAFCDNGGELLCCEGRCMRSFHATIEDGADFACPSLGYTKDQVKAIQYFLCKNCECKRHQCFICGRLGSSDKSGGVEVFACVDATCGYFYHPKCVSDWLFPDDIIQTAYHKNKVAKGEPFTCPAHKCHVCKQGENKEIKDLQFAVCRRCPTSYHSSCLPREIAFDDIRVWEGLLPGRILIYCLKHEIATRNHVLFPRIESKRKSINGQRNEPECLSNKTKLISDVYERSTCQMASNKNENFSKLIGKGKFAVKCSEISIAKMKLNHISRFKSAPTNAGCKSGTIDLLESGKFAKENSVENGAAESGDEVITSSYPEIHSEGKKRIANLMESTSNSITLEDIVEKCKMPSTHRGTSRNLDKYITWGKLEGSVKAVKIALGKLEDGGSMEDSKAVCEPIVMVDDPNHIFEKRADAEVIFTKDRS